MKVNISKHGHLFKQRGGLEITMQCPFKPVDTHCGDYCPKVVDVGFFRKKIKTCGATFIIDQDYRMNKQALEEEMRQQELETKDGQQ